MIAVLLQRVQVKRVRSRKGFGWPTLKEEEEDVAVVGSDWQLLAWPRVFYVARHFWLESINCIQRVQKIFPTEADSDKKHKTNKTISIHRKSRRLFLQSLSRFVVEIGPDPCCASISFVFLRCKCNHLTSFGWPSCRNLRNCSWVSDSCFELRLEHSMRKRIHHTYITMNQSAMLSRAFLMLSALYYICLFLHLLSAKNQSHR